MKEVDTLIAILISSSTLAKISSLRFHRLSSTNADTITKPFASWRTTYSNAAGSLKKTMLASGKFKMSWSAHWSSWSNKIRLHIHFKVTLLCSFIILLSNSIVVSIPINTWISRMFLKTTRLRFWRISLRWGRRMRKGAALASAN